LLSRISDSIQGSVAARARVSGQWGVRFSCDFAAGFHVLLKGSCLVQCNTTNQVLQMVPGDIVFFARGYYHELKSDPGANCVDVRDFRADLNMNPPESSRLKQTVPGMTQSQAEDTSFLSGRYVFPVGPLHPLFRALPEYFHIKGADLPLHDPIKGLIQILSQEFAREDASDAILSRITDTLFHYILRHWMLEHDSSSHWAALYADEAVLRAIESMEDRMEYPWTVDSLAGAQGLSRATLARRFKEATGTGPMEYLKQIRMQRAARMLQNGEGNVEHISMRVGYESPFSFSRSFKRFYGLSPREFRASDATQATITRSL